jgi:predicted phosphate transport protein (TIGR00153 family)
MVALRFKPVDNTFYTLLTESATRLVEGAAILAELLGDSADRNDIADRMRDAEHEADETTHEIAKRVNSTFVTPFDREDIYRLTAALDDVVDAIEEAANRIVLYRLAELPPGVSAQVDVLCRAAEVTAEAMPQLSDVGKLDGFTSEVNALEDEADAIHHDLLGTLLAPRGDLAPVDVLRIITLKEVVDTLEDAADAFETVANTVESIAVKES